MKQYIGVYGGLWLEIGFWLHEPDFMTSEFMDQTKVKWATENGFHDWKREHL